MRGIYKPLTDSGVPLLVTDLATAELVKGAANAFLALKISFINAMADICATVNGDVRTLAASLGLDPRIGQAFLKAGIGYGGACLPKDVRGLASFAEHNGASKAFELLMLVDTINSARRDRVVRMVEEAAGIPRTEGSPTENPLAGRRIAVLGAAFKPNTDDVRDSPGLDVASRLHLLGATVTVYDPMATGNALTEYPELSYADSALAALHRADVTVVAAAWPEFAGIDPAMARSVAASMAVVDACQGIDLGSWQEAGWSTRSLTGDSGVDRLTRHTVSDTGFL